MYPALLIKRREWLEAKQRGASPANPCRADEAKHIYFFALLGRIMGFSMDRTLFDAKSPYKQNAFIQIFTERFPALLVLNGLQGIQPRVESEPSSLP